MLKLRLSQRIQNKGKASLTPSTGFSSNAQAVRYQEELNRPTMSPAERAFSLRTTKVGWDPLMSPSPLQRTPQTKQTSPWVWRTAAGSGNQVRSKTQRLPPSGPRSWQRAPTPGGHPQASWRGDPSDWLASHGFGTRRRQEWARSTSGWRRGGGFSWTLKSKPGGRGRGMREQSANIFGEGLGKTGSGAAGAQQAALS